MALIACKECGKRIADTAKYCRGCGAQNAFNWLPGVKAIALIAILLFVPAYLLSLFQDPPYKPAVRKVFPAQKNIGFQDVEEYKSGNACGVAKSEVSAFRFIYRRNGTVTLFDLKDRQASFDRQWARFCK